MDNSVEPIPDGYTAVTPWIIGRDTAGLMDFLKAAFDGEELARLVGEDGAIGHAEMRIGGAVVMMFDAPKNQDWPDTPAFIRLFLADAAATFKKAIEAGATPITKVTHLAFGDRVGRVRDPFGNLWWLQTRVENVSEDEMNRRWTDPKWVRAMEYVQSSLVYRGGS